MTFPKAFGNISQQKFEDARARGTVCLRGIKSGNLSDQMNGHDTHHIYHFQEVSCQAEGGKLQISELNLKGDCELHRIKNLRLKKKKKKLR